MTGTLNHPPSQILQQLLIDRGMILDDRDDIVSSPEVAWPSFRNTMPDSPDNVVVISDTEGVSEGREHISGELIEKYGFQIRARGNQPKEGYIKAKRISDNSNKVHNVNVSLTDLVGTATATYKVQSVTPRSLIIPLKVANESRRYSWVYNGVLSIRKTN